MKRREFLGRAAKIALAAGLSPSLITSETFAKEESSVSKSELKKALVFGMLPGNLSTEDRMKLARDCGFDGVEAPPLTDPKETEAMRLAAEKAGIEIHSVIYGGWGKPLSAADEKTQDEAVQAAKEGLKGAKEMGAACLLLVPAVVNEHTRYEDAYHRSQKNIRRIIPTAKDLNVTIAIENVWNNFLLSPMEFARYVDELDSPFVRAYFDVGNVVAFGWPQDWIRTLGKRIYRVHVKDFKKDTREWKNLREGSVDWIEVRKALDEVGYKGYLTAELPGGDAAYLKDVAIRMDKIIAGE
ncbi:MAG: sugar phosphate isomerase/epimerase [Armatimonadetes bacterium]|nr:sugar phosphate isomerase/epimerase [Armatimonadota bacterium]